MKYVTVSDLVLMRCRNFRVVRVGGYHKAQASELLNAHVHKSLQAKRQM